MNKIYYKRQIATILTGWLGVGSLPGPKGTWGSLAALPFSWVIMNYSGREGLLLASIVCCVIGIFAVNNYVRFTKTKDPSFAVIDEVAGQWLTLIVLNQPSILGFAIGFMLFRLFDIVKPFPCRFLEKLPDGLGVMADDMMAGIYAGACLYGIQIFYPNV